MKGATRDERKVNIERTRWSRNKHHDLRQIQKSGWCVMAVLRLSSGAPDSRRGAGRLRISRPPNQIREKQVFFPHFDLVARGF